MLVRIRFRTGAPLSGKTGKNRHVVLMTSMLLTLMAVACSALGAWRLAADLSWAQEFAISDGLFSHWQVWMVMAALLQVAAIALGRYGRAEPEPIP
jgi:hypothetical protein